MRSNKINIRISRSLIAIALAAGAVSPACAGTLAYSSFLGGALNDKAYAVAVDNANNAYLTGTTNSTDFPSAAGGPIQAVKNTGNDIFVTKINPAGTTIIWSAYIGGAGEDVGRGIAVNPVSGRVYITGDTTDSGTFPKTVSFGTVGTGYDAFVAAIHADGSALYYADIFGGDADDTGNGIVVDTSDNVYVTGKTTSISGNSFPYTFGGGAPYTTGAAQIAGGGGASQAFVAKFTAGGAQVYATYLGGSGVAHGNAIAIDGNRNAYITGQTGNEFFTASDWPLCFKKTITGSLDAFIAKLDPTGATFLDKTYVGGSGVDEGTGIAVDGSNPPNVYITGFTDSANFPGASFVTVGQTTLVGNPDAFVFKLRTALTGASDGVYATYLGGSGDNRAAGIVLDSANNAYVTGTTTSGDFPVVGPISGGGVLQGSPEAFVTELGPTGATKVFSSYLGGTTQTDGQGIVLDSAKSIYVTGYTNSVTATFPIVAGSFQIANAGGLYDAFITKIGSPALPPACTIASVSPNSGFTLGGSTVTINITGFPGIGSLGVTFGGTAAASYKVNASSTTITAVTPAHVLGAVPLIVTALTGTCSQKTYNYVLTACGADSFFPSPATGPTANFAYCMALPGTVKVRIYNVVGDLVAKLEDARPAGPQLSQLNTARLAPGVYLYRLEKNYGGGNSTTSDVKKFVVRHQR